MPKFDRESTLNNTQKALNAVAERAKTPQEMFVDILKMSSGAAYTRERKFDYFHSIIAFKGVCDGVGTSTIVANTALALASLGLSICVIDTAMLSPSQDILLDKGVFEKGFVDKLLSNKVKIKDWFDMPYTNENVIHSSRTSKGVGVLSFIDRGIVDMASSSDNEFLVEMALEQLESKFDMILIDVCNEPTCVTATCLQRAHKVIQVWSNSAHQLSNIDAAVRNNVVLCVPLDKMRYIVTSMTIDDISFSWDDIFKKYGFEEIAHCPMSPNIARVNALSGTLFNITGTLLSDNTDLQLFNDCIANVVMHLLNIKTDVEAKPKKGKLFGKSKEDITEIEVSSKNSTAEETVIEPKAEVKRGGLFGRGGKKGVKEETKNDDSK